MSRWLLLPLMLLPLLAGTASAAQRDRDRDGLPDRWEKRYHLSTKRKSARGDADRDGLRNRREYRLRTNPRKKDTDGDGLRDRAEVRRYKTNPRKKDTDGDGFTDGQEVRAGTDPRKAQSAPPGSPSPTPTPPPGPPPARCDVNATPASLAGQVSVAAGGEVICLETGDYGTWSGTDKRVTLRRADGATPTMRFRFGPGDANFVVDGVSGAGGRVDGGVSNVVVRNSAFNTCMFFFGSNSDVVFDGNTHLDIDATCHNARLHMGGSGVTVKNSLLSGGDSDGAFIASDGVTLEGNRIINVCEGPTGNHTDGIQFEDPNGIGVPDSSQSYGYDAVVRGNYFNFMGCPVTAGQALSSYDSGTEGALLEDNVIDTTRPWGIELYSDEGSVVRHNTVRYYGPGTCAFNQQCGRIALDRKPADPAGSGTQVYDNVAVVMSGNGSTAARNDHNTNPATVSHVGPLTSWAGFALAPGSPGKGAASDGLDTGIRVP
jgi:hypothetical protein